MKKRIVYFSLSLLCFLSCVFIVKFFNHNLFIRGTIGDMIVISLIFYIVKLFYDFNSLKLTIFTLAIAFTTEFLQYLKIIKLFGLEHNALAGLIFGSVFDPFDLLAYTAGAVLVFVVDAKGVKRIILNIK
jgi:hypothetical protein